MTNKFRRVFASNPSSRFDSDELLKIADRVIFICDSPMYDDLTGPENRHRFDARVARLLKDFDPDHDAIVFYGDPIIFAMMVLCLSQNTGAIKIARWSKRHSAYFVREISENDLMTEDA